MRRRRVAQGPTLTAAIGTQGRMSGASVPQFSVIDHVRAPWSPSWPCPPAHHHVERGLIPIVVSWGQGWVFRAWIGCWCQGWFVFEGVRGRHGRKCTPKGVMRARGTPGLVVESQQQGANRPSSAGREMAPKGATPKATQRAGFGFRTLDPDTVGASGSSAAPP